MKLLNSMGPNPRMVRMFMIEKGIELETLEHDILGAENRKSPYTDKNPGGQMPALELDDGSVLAETVVICEYLEELHPSPALIGTTAQERAETRMWTRRVEQKITENMYNGFRSLSAGGRRRLKNNCPGRSCLVGCADGRQGIRVRRPPHNCRPRALLLHRLRCRCWPECRSWPGDNQCLVRPGGCASKR